ncbi:MAG: efflux RND transporter periplasmic adaptor subunit [Candidatus Magasanikbacteria bacterium]|nr:efflux RND transporter periplasmic adaptor subunit [Candidatus Magasanikbacteria bacterium]
MKIKISKKIRITLLILFITAIVLIFASGVLSDDTETIITTEHRPQVQLLNLDDIRNIKETIEVTGEVESLEQVDIKSEVMGRITAVNVKLGDDVYPDQVIARLDNSSLLAQRGQMSADYMNTLAGKDQLKAQLEAQKANHKKVLVTAQNMISSAESNVKNAENNLRLNKSTSESQVVQDAYENALSVLINAQNTLNSVLIASDNILGIDNEKINDDFEILLSPLDRRYKKTANYSYKIARDKNEILKNQVAGLNINFAQSEVDTTISSMIETLDLFNKHLLDMTVMLDETLAIGSITQTRLDGFINTIQNSRSSVSSVYNSVLGAKQSIENAKSSLESYKIAYEKALRDLETAKLQAKTDIAASEAQIKQLEAGLQSQDAQILRAGSGISSVNASIAKTILTSPIYGKVAVLNAKKGELVSVGQLLASIVNLDGLQVKTYVDSYDLDTIRLGSKAILNKEHDGIVTHIAPSIDPSTKKVEVIIALSEKELPFVVGQFVDIEIEKNGTEGTEKPILLPLEAVSINSDNKTVYIVNRDGLIEEIEIEVNKIIGNKIEVTSGLQEIDYIVDSTRNTKPGDQVEILVN